MQSLDYKLKTSNTSYVTAWHDVQYFPSSLSSFSPTTSRVCRIPLTSGTSFIDPESIKIAFRVSGRHQPAGVANLHRCYLRQDPVFLRSLLRLVGRRVDRRFYFGHLLPGAQRGRAGRRTACAYVRLRNSKWGSFAQQRPLALSSVRRLQPPCNVTVQHQDALAYLRALPSLPHQCIHFPRPQHELLWYERGPRPGLSHGAARRTLREWPALRRQRQRRAGGPGALQRGRLHHKPVLGQEQFQARAACSAPGQSCCQHRNG